MPNNDWTNLLWMFDQALQTPQPDSHIAIDCMRSGPFQPGCWLDAESLEAGRGYRITIQCSVHDTLSYMQDHFGQHVIHLYVVNLQGTTLASGQLRPQGRLDFQKATASFRTLHLENLHAARIFLADRGRYCWGPTHRHCAGCGQQQVRKKGWFKGLDTGPANLELFFCSTDCFRAYEACNLPAKPTHS